MAEEGMNVKTMARLVKVSEKDVQKWIDETLCVTKITEIIINGAARNSPIVNINKGLYYKRHEEPPHMVMKWRKFTAWEWKDCEKRGELKAKETAHFHGRKA